MEHLSVIKSIYYLLELLFFIGNKNGGKVFTIEVDAGKSGILLFT